MDNDDVGYQLIDERLNDHTRQRAGLALDLGSEEDQQKGQDSSRPRDELGSMHRVYLGKHQASALMHCDAAASSGVGGLCRGTAKRRSRRTGRRIIEADYVQHRVAF